MTIAPGAWREVALSDDEYFQIVELLGREPRPVELGMFGAMWSEHCGYKHSRPLLKGFPTEAPWVLEGPGENAGAIDVGDGIAVVFKVESHNHPSAVEPYEGAATGVGGIVRDIFTMGARPIAILNALRFGPLENARNRYLFDNVVGGIGGYGNCLGIPTVGGEIFFDSSYNGNPLVNAMCIGVTRHDSIMRARASGPGNVIMVIGADTGRDGLHGATFSSVDDPEASHRGVIQVGNPFLEKLLLEACLELLQGDDVVAMQDLGAAGMTSSTVEVASRGGVGAEIDVALVPRREEGMTAYEVMLSESQERMLLVVRPDGVERVVEIVERWSLHAAAIGHVTDDGMVRVLDNGVIACEVPAELFTDACPTYFRPAEEHPAVIAARETAIDIADIEETDVSEIVVQLLNSPNIGSRRPVWERYDHTILTNTVVGPGQGDAAVLRLKGTKRGISTAIDCNSRYCWLDPELGAQHAVAEASRNVVCTGATPLAMTNCLNFGNPQKPAGYYQLSRAISGLAEACRVLNVPVVSGNVSLYNETAESAVMPTPTVGIVGVIEDVAARITMAPKSGDRLFLLHPGNKPTLGGTAYLSTVHGLTVGRPPAIDLNAELAVQRTALDLMGSSLISAAHDCSDGGIAVAVAEMAIASQCGVKLELVIADDERRDVAWFGEAPSRILLAISPDKVERLNGVHLPDSVVLTELGTFEGDQIQFGGSGVSRVRASIAFESALQHEPGEA
jgi:phosphoribosylformylglycinamidine synthase